MKAADFKFKAWDKTEKKFVKSKDLQNAHNLPVTPTRFGFKLKSRYELFQATGLKDIDGNDIYDGDQITVLRKSKKLKDSIYSVYYEEGSFLIHDGYGELGEANILLLSFAIKVWKAEKFDYKVTGHKKTM